MSDLAEGPPVADDPEPAAGRRDGVPAIRVRDVVKRYGKRTVLDGASLEVWPGELVALVGSSGVGKSTLVHLIAALDTPDAGTIEVMGEEIGHHHHQSRFRRSQVGLVFQLHNLVPRLTARQNVELALFGSGLGRKARKARAAEVLAAVGLAQWANSRPPTMSGGERQRVAIARALANNPPVLLTDEPTGNLDDESAATVLAVLRRLVDEEGVAVLAVSHDERLDRVADRRLGMRDGKITAAPARTI